MTVFIDEEVAARYTHFVEERHQVWRRRQAAEPRPWTDDPILASRKFTNVFRVLDPGSQFILKVLNETGTPEDALFRAFLYRYTNLPTSWEHVREVLGEYPTVDNAMDTMEVWQDRARRGEKVFSGAYVILPQPNIPGDKVAQAVQLAVRLFASPHAGAFLRTDPLDVRGRFAALRQLYGVGDFLAMQIITDWGYGPFGTDTEDDFVVAGPGATKGCNLLHDGSPNLVMDWAWDLWGVTGTVDLYGRMPSRMDVQNTFCEFFKYERFLSRGGNFSAPYSPAHPGLQPRPILPAHWKVTR